MWPTQGYRSAPAGGWSTFDRRARILTLLATGGLVLVMGVASWLAMRGEPPSTPVYGNAGGAPGVVWTWDGATYTRLPVTSAGPRSNTADLAYDRVRQVLVLWDHGCARLVMGFTGGCIDQVDQTWTWDGQAWQLRSPRSAPTAAGLGAMFFDDRLGQVVYVNGAGRAWTWNGADWLILPMNGAPHVPRRDSAAEASVFAAGYDEGRQQLVFALSGSTWTWNGGAWREVPGGIDLADARLDAHLVYDRSHRQLVYVGNRFTWTWDGGHWQPHPQPPIAGGTAAYDPLREAVMLVQQDASACDRSACRITTWTWDSTRWTQLAVEQGPLLPLTRSGASLPPLAFDEARRVMVLFASAS